jgi:heme exporter protein A
MQSHSTHSLQGEDLSCTRDDRELFAGLKFSVSPGQVLLLEGQNGSGKTTLLRIICGFREPDSGTVCGVGKLRHKRNFI